MLYMVLSQILKQNKNPAEIGNVDRQFAKQLNFKGIKFYVNKKDFKNSKTK